MSLNEGLVVLGPTGSPAPPSIRYSSCGSITNRSSTALTITFDSEVIGSDGAVYPIPSIFPQGTATQMVPGTRVGCGLAPDVFDIDFTHPFATSMRVRVRYQAPDGRSESIERTASLRVPSGVVHPPRVVVNEFRVHGPNGLTDQFVELYNDSLAPAILGHLTISVPNVGGATLVSLGGQSIGARCHYLITAPGYSGTVPGDALMPAALVTSSIISYNIVDANQQFDRVSMSSTNRVEGDPLQPFPTGPFPPGIPSRSYVRIGHDTNDNARDFVLGTGASPQNSSMCGSR